MKKPSLSAPSIAPKTWQRNIPNATQNANDSIAHIPGIGPELFNAWRCYTSSGAWSAASSAFASMHIETRTVAIPTSQCVVNELSARGVDIYTLCDGIPRARSGRYTSICSSVSTTHILSSATESFTIGTPECKIPVGVCGELSTCGLPLPSGNPCPLPCQVVPQTPFLGSKKLILESDICSKCATSILACSKSRRIPL